MATSWVRLDDQGFWAGDVNLEFILYFIAKDLTENVSAPWAREYAEHLYIQATAGMNGCVSPGFSNLDAEQLDAVYAATRRIVEQITKGELPLTADFINGLGLHGGDVHFAHDLPSEYVLEVAHALIALIENRRPGDAKT